MATNDPGWTANPTLVAAAASTLTLILTKFADVIMDRSNVGSQNQQAFIATLTNWNKDLQERLQVLDGQLEMVRTACTGLHLENAKLSAEIVVLCPPFSVCAGGPVHTEKGGQSMSEPTKAALRRVRRYLILPALAALIGCLQQYTATGSFSIDWNAVAVVTVTALLAGLSKWIRDEIDVDVQVV
jgi:hypothetical protein